jgi:two-component system response regulator ResD
MKRILIVDDEAVARRLLALTLSRAGYEVSQACNGLQAWEMLQQCQPDVLVTDIDMPQMTGEELCKRIHDRIGRRTWPIFVVTAKTSLDHRAWSSGIDNLHFLEKPFSMRALVERLDMVLRLGDAA